MFQFQHQLNKSGCKRSITKTQSTSQSQFYEFLAKTGARKPATECSLVVNEVLLTKVTCHYTNDHIELREMGMVSRFLQGGKIIEVFLCGKLINIYDNIRSVYHGYKVWLTTLHTCIQQWLLTREALILAHIMTMCLIREQLSGVSGFSRQANRA